MKSRVEGPAGLRSGEGSPLGLQMSGTLTGEPGIQLQAHGTAPPSQIGTVNTGRGVLLSFVSKQYSVSPPGSPGLRGECGALGWVSPREGTRKMLLRAGVSEGSEARPAACRARQGGQLSPLGPTAQLGPEAHSLPKGGAKVGGVAGVGGTESLEAAVPARRHWGQCCRGVPGRAGRMDVGREGRAAGAGRGCTGTSETLSPESLPLIPMGSINVPMKMEI